MAISSSSASVMLSPRATSTPRSMTPFVCVRTSDQFSPWPGLPVLGLVPGNPAIQTGSAGRARRWRVSHNHAIPHAGGGAPWEAAMLKVSDGTLINEQQLEPDDEAEYQFSI